MNSPLIELGVDVGKLAVSMGAEQSSVSDVLYAWNKMETDVSIFNK